MVTGLMQCQSSNPTQWTAYVESKATFAQSTETRFNRWLENVLVNGQKLYEPLILSALKHWGCSEVELALDTSMLFEHFCMIRIVLLYRGRGVTIAWEVIEHHSASVDLAQLLEVLDTAKTILTRAGIQKVTLLADRGFADTALMTYLKALKWSFIIRIKASFGLYSPSGALLCKVGQVALRTGQSKHYHNVLMTKKLFGLVHVGLARVRGAKEPWFIVSDQPTSNVSFTIYGKRFDIEQVFKDDKSAGFDLEQSGLRDATKLGRLMTVLVIAMLLLVAEGTRVVKSGWRRLVDGHWFRGLSYLQLGWRYLRYALTRGEDFLVGLDLLGGVDPDPSRKKKSWFDPVAGLKCQTMVFRVP